MHATLVACSCYYPVYKDITTYDFIVMEQKRVREQARAKAEAARTPDPPKSHPESKVSRTHILVM
jgi:hypothetical protein